MKIYLESEVEKKASEVFSLFNKDLFLKLAPPFPPSRLIRFDGSKRGDLVHLQVWNGGWQDWISEIIADGESENSFYFVDQGTKLPWPLKEWNHRHVVKAGLDGGSVIVDHIEYSTGSNVLDKMIFPFLKAQFKYRQPIYKKEFKATNN